MPGRLQRDKSSHPGRHQLGLVAGQPVKGCVAAAFAEQASGVGHDPDFELGFKQTKRRLHQAGMRFTTGNDAGVAARLPFSRGILQKREQAACVTTLS